MARCRVCREVYTKRTSTMVVCSPDCALKLAIRSSEKRKKADALKDRKQTRERLAKFKTKSDYIKEAQREFNRFIRLRDAGKPCICCGAPLEGASDASGGAFDCGHYRSVGSASHLRFDERNAHGQTKKCNRWGAGRAVDYRMGLRVRLGDAVVEALEADNTPRKWTIPELQEIKRTYKARADQLQKEKA